MTSAESVEKAIRFAKAGQRTQALALLREALQQEPDNVRALCWLAGLTPDLHEGIAALEKAQALEPDNPVVQRGLEALRAKLPAPVASLPDAPERTTLNPLLPHPEPASLSVSIETTTTESPAAGSHTDAPAPGVERLLPAAPDLGRDEPTPAPLSVESDLAGAGALRVLRCSSYLRQLEERKHQQSHAWLITSLCVMAASLVLGVTPAVTLAMGLARLPVSWSIAGVALALIANFILAPIVLKLKRERDQYRQGRRGEERATAALQGSLNGSWALYCNAMLNDGQGDIDGILVGPRGVFVLEVKAYSGFLRNQGDRWEHRSAGVWRPCPWNPTAQARANALRLRDFLRQRDLSTFVEPRVVWAGQRRLLFDKPAVRLWFPDAAEQILADIQRQRPVTTAIIERIQAALEELCPPNAGS